MSGNNKGLSKYQYGCIKGKFTVDAIGHIRAKNKIEEGMCVMAVRLDIKNAFNSLEWVEINRAIKNKGLPVYIREIMKDYLKDRSIVWEGKHGVK